MSVISVLDLGKCFRLYQNRWQKLASAVLKTGNHAREFWALRHVHFELPPGTSLGVIGPNGAGKTTLLQLLAGLLKPNEGAIDVHGTLATLLELGGAFSMELTGRENIFVSAGLRGFSRRQIQQKLDEIVDFSELEQFIDYPIKHYSTGMLMRLAFATAINVEPSILLVDEVFAVGDIAFQHKCVRRFRDLQEKGTTVVLVSHDITAVKSFCDRCLLLDQGSQVRFGDTEEVTNCYLSLVAAKIASQAPSPSASGGAQQASASAPDRTGGMQATDLLKAQHRHGSGEGRILAINILDSQGRPVESIAFGEEATFRFTVEYCTDVEESILGFYIRDRYGNDIIGMNTYEEGHPLGQRKKGDRLCVDFRLPLWLKEGSYSVSPGFSLHRTEPRYLDWIDNAAFFRMQARPGGRHVHGLMHVPGRIRIEPL